MDLVTFVRSTRLRRSLAALASTLALCLVAQPSGAAQNVRFTNPGAARTFSSGKVRQLASQPPFIMQLAFLMTDGSVLAQTEQGQTWYRYVPDINGNYQNGTWSQVGSLQNGYDPSAFASAVLADGRLAIIGGEYNGNGPYELQLTNLGAIYDPKTSAWTPLGHPQGWQYIGDSPSSVLPGGQFFVGQKLTERGAWLNPQTLKWTEASTKGKADFNAEEGYTLLPDGSILTADVKDAPNSERYLASQGKWVTAGSTIVDLHSPTPIQGCLQYGPKPQDCYYPPGEIGPAILRPDGTVFATGSGSGPDGNGAGHTAIYNTLTGKWAVGPDFPNGDNAGDSFAALLPSGNVLVLGVYGYLYEFDGSTFSTVGEVSGVPLLLPTGQVMMLGNTVVLYTASGKPQPAWAPAVTKVAKSVSRGSTYQIFGTQFNGLSQAMSFGDEFQNATNYPLVRITNGKSHHVFYAKTHDHSSMGVATGKTIVYTYFDVPAKMETGASSLEVVANGIPSPSVPITVH